LSDWVDVLADHYLVDPMLDAERAQAEDAIRHIGTKSVPYLLDWIRADPPSRNGVVYRLGCEILNRFHLQWQFPQDRHSFLDMGAAQALAVLGPEAEGTITELRELLNDGRCPFNARRAADALARIGNAGLPPLLSVLTNDAAAFELRWYVAFQQHGVSDLPIATTALQHALTNADRSVRRCATNLLLQLGPRSLCWVEMSTH